MAEALRGSPDVLTLPEPSRRGHLVIKDQVVETIAEIAALEVPSVNKVASQFNPLRRSLPRAEVTLTPSHARVTIQVATRFDRALFDVAAEVRDSVAATVNRLTAITVDIVNVDITSVSPVETQQRDDPTTPARRNLL